MRNLFFIITLLLSVQLQSQEILLSYRCYHYDKKVKLIGINVYFPEFENVKVTLYNGLRDTVNSFLSKMLKLWRRR